MSYPYNDQPPENTPSMEPTLPARNPYEISNPYSSYGTSPDIPPPPPQMKRPKPGLIWLIGIGFLLALVLLSFFGYALYQRTNNNTGKVTLPTTGPTTGPTTIPTVKPTIIIETPTPQPLTPTSNQVVPYYANDIYNDFVASGYGGTDAKTDTKWSCCTYVPAGGAIYWTDTRSGYVLDIATFYNVQDAQTDANDLFNHGFNANVVHACLLSYDKNVPGSVINPYVQLMQQYCN